MLIMSHHPRFAHPWHSHRARVSIVHLYTVVSGILGELRFLCLLGMKLPAVLRKVWPSALPLSQPYKHLVSGPGELAARKLFTRTEVRLGIGGSAFRESEQPKSRPSLPC